jgi:hypothetical protein
MRAASFLMSMAAAAGIALGGCHLFTNTAPNGPAPPADGGFSDCMAADVHSVVVQILPSVVVAISSSAYIQELASLVAQFGAAAVTCAVEYLETELSAMKAAGAQDSDIDIMLAHARAYLGMKGAPDAPRASYRFTGPSTAI